MIIKEMPWREPALCFEPLQNRPYAFFLDSGLDHKGLGRYSVIGSDTFLVFKTKGDQITLEHQGNLMAYRGHPLDELDLLMRRYRVANVPFLPLTSGAVGYFAYDLGRQLERLPDLARDDLALPDCCLGFYDRLLIFDHLERRAWLTSTGLPESGERAKLRAGERLKDLEDLVAGAPNGISTGPEPLPGSGSLTLTSHFTKESYCRAVQRIKDYIAAGDIFQANMTQRFSCPLAARPWDFYRHLRRINPAPFAAYLSYPEVTVASSSPERFLQVRQGMVETRPIKGTRPRGRDAEEDARMRQELWESAKDRAELAMIIDLERNDLGRVCEFGSVHVPRLYTIETYATVFHLVSTVRGRLRADKNLVDLLRATFPGGSITGAPKIRAMEIIEELEPVRRGIYTGSIGYLGFDGTADLNIVIRTCIIKDDLVYFQVGGGITADSDPEAEYRETIDKARALVMALGCGEVAAL